MINQLLNQLATSSEAEARRAPVAPKPSPKAFATEMSRQLLGASKAPKRNAEGEARGSSIEGAVRRHVGEERVAQPDAEPSLTGLLLDPPPTSEEIVDARGFEDEHTSTELPSLRSASMPAEPSVSSTDALLKERALARFTGDASSSGRIALERTPAQVTPRARDAARYRANAVEVKARGAAALIPSREGSGPVVRAVDQPGEPRVERITKPIKPSLLQPEPPTRRIVAETAKAAVTAQSPAAPPSAAQLSSTRPAPSRSAKPVELKRPDQWATPQIVHTIDEAWRPDADEAQRVAPVVEPSEAAPTELQEAVEPVNDGVGPVREASVSDAFRSYVEGQRAHLSEPLTSSASVMRAVVDQVRSLMDGLGLEGHLKLRTDGAEVQVQSDALGTLAARIGVEHGVVDLTLSGQAAASLTAELDALKAMLAEAGLTVGTVKTSSLSSDAESEHKGHNGRDHEDAPRSGSAVAEQEGGARGSSRSRRRAHHGQVNVSA
jgi:hypothetical protein